MLNNIQAGTTTLAPPSVPGESPVDREVLDIPYLGDVPIQIAIREHGDAGRTGENFSDEQSRPYLEAICERVVSGLATKHAAAPPKPSLPVL